MPEPVILPANVSAIAYFKPTRKKPQAGSEESGRIYRAGHVAGKRSGDAKMESVYASETSRKLAEELLGRPARREAQFVQ